MFSSGLSKIIRENQPVSITGIFSHSISWLLSNGQDSFYPNKAFVPVDAGSSIKRSAITIYCIHGTADRVSSFTKIAERLFDKLPDNIASIRLVAFTNRVKGAGIETFAEELKDKIIANNDQDVVVIGHSRGGLISAYFAEYLADAAGIKVHGVCCICSPLGGSDLAMFPLTHFSLSVEQMVPGSQFLRSLAEKVAGSSRYYRYFTASQDAIVTADAACIPAHRHTLIELDRHGHISIMSSWRLVEHLKEYIGNICWHQKLLHTMSISVDSGSDNRVNMSAINVQSKEDAPVSDGKDDSRS